MAQRLLITAGIAVVVMAMLSFQTSAQSTSGCMTSLVSLSSCLNYITGNSSTPASSCCSSLSSIVKNEPQCLCVLLNGGASSMGVTINTTKALELPPACKVQTPPVSLCKTLGAPAAAPSTSTETPSTSTTPSTPSTPSTSTGSAGSKASPSTTGESSDAISNKSVVFSIFFLAVSSLASMI